ncbi:hypothetical protein FRACYDRAFT_233011 [Fragilariopsis cylindrus CCMP1102]|uniref:Uncharacterized protein n=1 Tax=Fragilariopsis cylindrus CCMP1102 TaxID=635003 RepID=A0A1E7FXH9_9STRA|nr:hypothetical protein FRACYDRAFT_233011 [Fragilariopsis cylindrus CCMP1102]|eukprot:OEU22847.1 hypothetical protein FRACYDRAFT_233011 [Fragilariopsis cylindrus CCMP1102]
MTTHHSSTHSRWTQLKQKQERERLDLQHKHEMETEMEIEKNNNETNTAPATKIASIPLYSSPTNTAPATKVAAIPLCSSSARLATKPAIAKKRTAKKVIKSRASYRKNVTGGSSRLSTPSPSTQGNLKLRGIRGSLERALVNTKDRLKYATCPAKISKEKIILADQTMKLRQQEAEDFLNQHEKSLLADQAARLRHEKNLMLQERLNFAEQAVKLGQEAAKESLMQNEYSINALSVLSEEQKRCHSTASTAIQSFRTAIQSAHSTASMAIQSSRMLHISVDKLSDNLMAQSQDRMNMIRLHVKRFSESGRKKNKKNSPFELFLTGPSNVQVQSTARLSETFDFHSESSDQSSDNGEEEENNENIERNWNIEQLSKLSEPSDMGPTLGECIARSKSTSLGFDPNSTSSSSSHSAAFSDDASLNPRRLRYKNDSSDNEEEEENDPNEFQNSTGGSR